MVRKYSIVAVLWATLLAGCGAREQHTTPVEVAQWEPDGESLGNLAPAFQLPGQPYEIRPPKGGRYERLPTPAPLFACAWYWKRQDGTPVELRIVLNPTSDGAPELDNLITSMLSNRAGNSQQFDITFGSIGGIVFSHAEWSGISPKTSADLRGFMYVGIDDGKIIQISSEDGIGRGDASLQIAETAARTFRRTD